MSAIGAALARGVASLGGPQVAAVVVAGGLITGGLGGAFIGSGGPSGQSATAAGELAVYPCPDQGPALTSIKGGQKLLATGRTEDGAWLRIHYPLPGRTEAWVQASPLSVAGAVDSLPVATCQAEFAAGSPDVLPGATLTAILNLSPSPAPTPEPSPTPNAKPSLASLTVSTTKISYDTGSYCPTAVKKATFKVKARDASGLAGVTLFWREPGASSYAQSAMTRVAGSATSGTWQVTLDTTANGITKAGKLAYYAVATDTEGATGRIPASGASSVTVAVCANTGPTITSASSSSGSSLSWDPLGVDNCRTATNITAAVKDVDGVKSVTLVYRRPGTTTWSSKPMSLVAGKWSARLDTNKDKITIRTPPTGTLSWYIKAVDDKGVASQTKTASITIRRCDTEAQFDNVFPTSQVYACTTSARITIGTYANDEDQPEYGIKVVFHWTLTNPRTGAGPISGTVTAKRVGSFNYYEGSTATFNGKTFSVGRLSVYAVTTDKYGGRTTSPTDPPYTMSCLP